MTADMNRNRDTLEHLGHTQFRSFKYLMAETWSNLWFKACFRYTRALVDGRDGRLPILYRVDDTKYI